MNVNQITAEDMLKKMVHINTARRAGERLNSRKILNRLGAITLLGLVETSLKVTGQKDEPGGE